MTEVKIYTITSDDLSPPITGEGFCVDMVRHSDYAALEARLNKQAAEIADLTKFIEEDCWVIDPDQDEYIDAAQCVPETPTSDAWQREQMARGVEKFAEMTEKVSAEEDFYDNGESAATLKYVAKQAQLGGE